MWKRTRATMPFWSASPECWSRYSVRPRPILCRCHGIGEETIRQAIRVNDVKDAETLVAITGAGTGCGTCRADLVRLIDEAQAPKAEAKPAAVPGAGAGRIGLMHRINRTVAQLAVGWQAAGGSIEPWDLDGTLLRVKAVGAFASDAEAKRQALADLEAALKAQVDPALGVSEAQAAEPGAPAGS